MKKNIYLTSDTHFNHSNIIEYCPKSRSHFSSVEEMNETIITNWNRIISPDDVVYHLGDLCMGKTQDIVPLVSRLNGKITLLRGNHDHSKRRKDYEKCGIIIKDIDYISYKGKYFILSHIPIGNPECMSHLIGENAEIWNLHGHTHQYDYFSTTPNTFHVGVDSNDMKPITLDQVWELINLNEEFSVYELPWN